MSREGIESVWLLIERLAGGRTVSYEEIRSGIVDGSGDGGIDGIYVIANRNSFTKTVICRS